jgi:hypothetical protein
MTLSHDTDRVAASDVCNIASIGEELMMACAQETVTRCGMRSVRSRARRWSVMVSMSLTFDRECG